MPRFFVSGDSIDFSAGIIIIDGEDAHHITRSLRMAPGERITICDGVKNEYDCVFIRADGEHVLCEIKSKTELSTEPPFEVSIFQALPKGDKLDTIIQKSVECGALSIRTFESEFCVAREKSETVQRKLERRGRIALEAAKQCGRGIVPKVLPTVDFKTAVKEAALADIPIFCYEGEGTLPLGKLISDKRKELGDTLCTPKISVVIGSEGGFSAEESKFAKENGMLMAGLGRRILRAETVAGFVLACLVYEFEL